MIKASNKGCFLCQGFLLQTLTTNRTAGERGDHLLFFSITSSRSGISTHLLATLTFVCMWHVYHVFLITSLETYGLLLTEIYDRNILPFIWLINDGMLNFLFVFGFYYNNLTLENGGCELVSTVTFVLQANLPNKFPRDTEFVVWTCYCYV